MSKEEFLEDFEAIEIIGDLLGKYVVAQLGYNPIKRVGELEARVKELEWALEPFATFSCSEERFDITVEREEVEYARQVLERGKL